LLLDFLLKLVAAALKLRAGNDLVIHPGGDLLDDGIRAKGGQAGDGQQY
jgi:hypothetical protein